MRHIMRHPVALGLLAAALFGSATPISKGLLAGLSPFHLAGLLYLGAAVGLAPRLLLGSRWRPAWRVDARNWRLLVGAVLLGGVGGPVALLFGLRLAAAASVSLWLTFELVATALLGYVLFRDHLGGFGWAAVGGAVLGAGILSWGEGAAGIPAGSLVLLACLCWGFDNHLTALIDGLTPEESTFWKGLVAGTVNLLVGVATQPVDAAAPVLLGALALGAFAYGLSIVFYISAAQRLGATRAQLLFASAPFFGVAGSLLWLREPLTAAQGVAALVLAGSLLLLFRDQHAHVHEHAETVHEHWHRHDDAHHDHWHPDLPVGVGHSHLHTHESRTHAHPHWPDLHHRHQHSG